MKQRRWAKEVLIRMEKTNGLCGKLSSPFFFSPVGFLSTLQRLIVLLRQRCGNVLTIWTPTARRKVAKSEEWR
jgi:hypothetical protein